MRLEIELSIAVVVLLVPMGFIVSSPISSFFIWATRKRTPRREVEQRAGDATAPREISQVSGKELRMRETKNRGLLLCYTLGMGVEFTASVDKHGIPREDSLYAIMNAEASAELDGEPGEVTMVYVGHPHGQTDRYIEVIAAHRPPRTIVIFHAMPLSDLFRHLLDEGK